MAHYRRPYAVGRRLYDHPGFIKADILIDIDGPYEEPERNFRALLPVVSRIKALLQLKPIYTAFSGKKGFHLLFEDPLDYKVPPGRQRERLNAQYRRRLADYLEEKNILFDRAVLLDTRRIVRIPFTFHSATGLPCLPLAPHEQDFKAILRYKITRPRPMITLKVSENPPGRVPGAIFAWAVSSRLPGKNLHVIFLEDPQYSPVKLFPQYPWWRMDAFGKRYYISPHVLTHTDVVEVMERTKSRNLNVFLRNRHALLPWQTLDGRVFSARLIHAADDPHISAEHLNLLMNKPAHLTWRLVRIA